MRKYFSKAAVPDYIRRGLQLILAISALYALRALWANGDGGRRGIYLLMVIQCAGGIFLMWLAGFVCRKFQIQAGAPLRISFHAFIFSAIFLGEVLSFYYRFSFWDSLLHAFSGFTLALIGFNLPGLFHRGRDLPLHPLYVAMAAFGFAASIGLFWEIYEFTVDYFLGTNMQKFLLEDGTPLIGQAALMDTMQDMIENSLGALLAAVLGYHGLKGKGKWLRWFSLIPQEDQLD